MLRPDARERKTKISVKVCREAQKKGDIYDTVMIRWIMSASITSREEVAFSWYEFQQTTHAGIECHKLIITIYNDIIMGKKEQKIWNGRLAACRHDV